MHKCYVNRNKKNIKTLIFDIFIFDYLLEILPFIKEIDKK